MAKVGESGVLHFWTTGEAYTKLVYNFFREGEFDRVEKLVDEGNLGPDQINLVFRGRFKLHGDTRQGDLFCEFPDAPYEKFNESLYWSILTAIRRKHNSDYKDLGVKDIKYIAKQGDKDIVALLRHFTVDEIFTICQGNILSEEGFKKTTLYDAISKSDYTISGMLLQNGDFIECGYQEHMSLFPVLQRLNLVNGEDRFNCDALPISSSLISGGLGFTLESMSFHYEREYTISERQIEEMWKVRERHLRHYSGVRDSPINNALRECFAHNLKMGGKYGNLKFLQKFYPEIKICEFSDTYQKSYGKTFVRTSPLRSMPGLLNSILVTSKKQADAAVKKIKSDYEAIGVLKSHNEIHHFYQKWEAGENGVVNCIAKPKSEYPSTMSPEYTATLKYDIYIACSAKQGDIVGGKAPSFELSQDDQQYLRSTIRQFSEDFGMDTQIEFVRVAEGDIRIVQLRTLKNKPGSVSDHPEETMKGSIVRGKSFSYNDYSSSTIKVSEILIVKEDGKAEDLIGKSALIVEADTNFSHILALSKAMNIPSMYATGKVDLSGMEEVHFNTSNKTAYIKYHG